MQQDLTQLNVSEKTELAFLSVLIGVVDDKSDEGYLSHILTEIAVEQPALQNLARFLYLTGQYTEQQGEATKRLCMLVWLYYKDRLKTPPVRITDELFLEKKAEYQLLLDKSKEMPEDDYIKLLQNYLQTNPARFIYGYIQGQLFEESSSPLMQLPLDAKLSLQNNFKVMIDCFESLTDRSIVPNYLKHDLQ